MSISSLEQERCALCVCAVCAVCGVCVLCTHRCVWCGWRASPVLAIFLCMHVVFFWYRLCLYRLCICVLWFERRPAKDWISSANHRWFLISSLIWLVLDYSCILVPMFFNYLRVLISGNILKVCSNSLTNGYLKILFSDSVSVCEASTVFTSSSESSICETYIMIMMIMWD